ncbi:MAG: helix-turn-helix domain-containing protein [Nanoarchaeota archaeon]
MREVLREIGLSDNEVSIYLSLLELGEVLASRIGEKARMNRTQTYDILESLIAKGLVSYVIKENRKYFSAVTPERIEEYLQEKKKAIQEQEKKLKGILPRLIGLQKSAKTQTKAEIYHGKEGIKTVYSDILRNAKEYYLLGGTGKIAEILEFYFLHHEKERIQKKIKLRALFNSSMKNLPIATQRKFFEARFLPDQFSSPIPILIYNNKVVSIIWSEPLAIVIENKEVAQTYSQYFELLWKQASS